MAPRPRGNEDFDPRVGEPSARERRIARQPKGRPTLRATSSSRIEDRRGESPLDAQRQRVRDILSGDQKVREATTRVLNVPLTPGGRQMVAGIENLGQRGSGDSMSMAANMDAYFRRLMAQSPQGTVGSGPQPASRYTEIAYGDIDKTQQQFRESLRQAMMRRQARDILEGGQPSVSQMLTQSQRASFPAYTDIADMPIDPIYGADDRRQYPNGEMYYDAEDIDTIEDALAERRRLMPMTPPWLQAQNWNRGQNPFSPNATARYQPR